MRTSVLLPAISVILCCGLDVVSAQPTGIVTQGSPDTIIGGKSGGA